MPVTIIYPKAVGGVNTYVNNLAEFMISSNVTVKVISYRITDKLFSTHKKERKETGYFIDIAFSKYATRISNYSLIKKYINDDDILICNDSLEIDAINYFKLKNYTASVFHGDLDHYYNLVDRYYTLINSIICVSEGLVKKNKAKYTGIDVKLLHPIIKNSDTKTNISTSGPLRVLYVSRLSHDKGADILINTIENSENKNIPVAWKVIAPTDGSEDYLLKQLSEQLNIKYNLSNSDVLKEMANSDILFFPSRTEGFGIVVLEAMKKGVVPVVNNLPFGIPDMVLNNENGFIIDIDKPERILEIFQYLFANRNILQSVSLNAYAYANTKFDPTKIGNTFLQYVTSMSAEKKKKYFIKQQLSYTERVLPECLYRVMKWLFRN